MLRFDGLSLSGFKSFASRAEVVLPDGISCVVGPNGCGKSNIVDAVTWVLGEQRARFLRGAKMEDVIFAGARTRKPAGLAEVSLRFEPREGARLGPAEATEPGQADGVAEIDPRLREPLEITRRLYRNGDSEYLLNGRRVRLKDVTELLSGTGLTTRAYSIIGQGRVEQILNSKPTDRRILIEEAAGIAGYRAKRKAAKVKLDESEQNLLRVTDIISEIEKQLRSLKRQASSARRYRRLSGRQRVVLRALYAAGHVEAARRLEELSAELERLRQVEAESRQALAELEEAARTARERVAGLEESRDQLAHQKHEAQLQVERSRNQVASCKARLGDNADQAQRNGTAHRAAESELRAVEGRLAGHRDRVRQLEEELQDSEAALAECSETAVGSRQQLEAAHRLIAETKENIFETMSESAGLRNRRQEAEESLGRLEAQANRLAASVAEGEAEVQTVAGQVEQGRVRLQSALDQEDTLRSQLEAAAACLAEQSDGLDRLASASGQARRELHDSEWKLAAVAETIRTRATHGEGVRRFLEATPPGALGTVADFLDVRPGDELACEKALESWLQAVVFESREAAEAAARRLAGGDDVEVRFVFPEAREPAAGRRPDDPRIGGALRDSVSVGEPELRWLERLVPEVWLVEDVTATVELARAHPDATFVSRDGVVLGPGGRGSAGRPMGAGDGILETRARHEHLAARVEELRGRSQAVDAELAVTEEQMTEIAAQRDVLGGQVATAEKESLSSRHALEGQRQAVEAAEARLDTLRYERDSAVDELEEARQRIADYGRRLDEAANRRRELDAVLAESQESATALEGQVADADAAFSRRREEVAIKRERRQAAATELEPVERELAQVGERVELLRGESEALAHQRAQLERLIAESEEAIQAGSDAWGALRDRLEEVEKELRDEREELVEGATRLRELRLEHESRARSAADCDVRRERAASELEHLGESCLRELGVEPQVLELPRPPSEADPEAEGEVEAEADAEATDRPPTEGADEPGEGAESTPPRTIGPPDRPIDESLPWQEDGTLEISALEAEAEELRGKLARIGPVNLVAIEEYEEQEERRGFLTKERDDLTESITSLRATIGEIDKTSRKRFIECFAVVKESFDECFRTLFHGGRAQLRLQDEDDVLESGIEIIAQPPGKRLQNMMLLSGGEKALTAIALLFALFRYKPSPFCVLDEVDAPLDEANVVRFLDLVDSMAAETQFIVVTHNRRTMEAASVLYGVTMEEQGCSKLVSVEFQRMVAAAGAA